MDELVHYLAFTVLGALARDAARSIGGPAAAALAVVLVLVVNLGYRRLAAGRRRGRDRTW